MNKKIIAAVVLGIVIIIAVIVDGAIWLNQKNNIQGIIINSCPTRPRVCANGTTVCREKKESCPEDLSACTEEAKICPDGYAVGRTGPNCEFAECPNSAVTSDKISVELPSVNQEISSPMDFFGKARGGWFFEGSFPVEIYDSNNKLLGSSVAAFLPLNEGDTWMTNDLVNFQGGIQFDEPTTNSGYMLFRKDNPSGNPAMDESFKVEIKFKQTDTNTASWQTYRNEKYGFEFSFPKDWRIEPTGDLTDFGEKDFILFNSGLMLNESVAVWDTSTYSVDTLKAMGNIVVDVKEKKTTLDNNPATEIFYTVVADAQLGSNQMKKTIVLKNNLVYLITCNITNCEKILSTFKFIK